MSALHEVVAFTDSDCLPASNWPQRIEGHFERDASLDGTGGKVLLSSPRNRIQAYSAMVFETIMRFPQEACLVTTKQMRGSFAGANCAYKKQSVLSVGGFSEAFMNHAEEIDLFWRLVDNKARLLFDPAITVEHLEYADTLRKLVRGNFNYGIASTKLAKYHIGRQFDLKLYKLLLKSVASAANPFSGDEWARLRAIQLSAFIAGKLYSSVRFRAINL